MSRNEQGDLDAYVVLINAEEQYSIWPSWKEIPSGWQSAGKVGSKMECMEYVEAVWRDMRPLSLRKHSDQDDGHHAFGH